MSNDENENKIWWEQFDSFFWLSIAGLVISCKVVLLKLCMKSTCKVFKCNSSGIECIRGDEETIDVKVDSLETPTSAKASYGDAPPLQRMERNNLSDISIDESGENQQRSNRSSQENNRE